MHREFEHRAFLIDHAVELGVRVAAKMAAARQFADVLANSGDLQRLAVDAGVMQIDVPNEDRVIGRDAVEFGFREVAALQQIVEIGADDPLPFGVLAASCLRCATRFWRVGYLA